MTRQLSKEQQWAAMVAEGSTWIAMLHGPDRSPATEAGLRRWLAEDPLHARAFELATETWNETQAVVKRGVKIKVIVPRRFTTRLRARWSPALAASVIVVALTVALGVAFHFRPSTITTAVGERRSLQLEDGTQLILNTATRVAIDYDKRQRHVRLDSGEAIFEVAHRPDWPFVVTVAGRDVTALGTAFLVRRGDERAAVTLLEGKISVTPADAGSVPTAVPAGRTAVLKPGERLSFHPNSSVQELDRPSLGPLTAWRLGKIDIEDLTLSEAVLEMNRYSQLKIEVVSPRAATIRLSGVFGVGDSLNFANAVARTYGLQLRQDSSGIVLSDVAPRTHRAP